MTLIVGDAPAMLRDLVALIGERHDDVVVDLRDGGAVAAVQPPAAPFTVEDHAVGAGRIFYQPAHQRRTEVEAHARIVVDDPDDLLLAVHGTGRAVGRIALGTDSL